MGSETSPEKRARENGEVVVVKMRKLKAVPKRFNVVFGEEYLNCINKSGRDYF
jgi:hypothetical protein